MRISSGEKAQLITRTHLKTNTGHCVLIVPSVCPFYNPGKATSAHQPSQPQLYSFPAASICTDSRSIDPPHETCQAFRFNQSWATRFFSKDRRLWCPNLLSPPHIHCTSNLTEFQHSHWHMMYSTLRGGILYLSHFRFSDRIVQIKVCRCPDWMAGDEIREQKSHGASRVQDYFPLADIRPCKPHRRIGSVMPEAEIWPRGTSSSLWRKSKHFFVANLLKYTWVTYLLLFIEEKAYNRNG